MGNLQVDARISRNYVDEVLGFVNVNMFVLMSSSDLGEANHTEKLPGL